VALVSLHRLLWRAAVPERWRAAGIAHASMQRLLAAHDIKPHLSCTFYVWQAKSEDILRKITAAREELTAVTVG